jgi:hypothetical protein
MMIKPFLTFIVVALFGLSAFAQQKVAPYEVPLKYENKNQVDPKPLSVRVVLGRVVSEVGDIGAAQETGAVPGARLGIFTEQEHHLVVTTVADKEGRFQFPTVLPGKYRLVVYVAGLCVANAPLQVVKGSRSNDQKQIVIHMRPVGIDSCSYGDYK